MVQEEMTKAIMMLRVSEKLLEMQEDMLKMVSSERMEECAVAFEITDKLSLVTGEAELRETCNAFGEYVAKEVGEGTAEFYSNVHFMMIVLYQYVEEKDNG